MAPPETADRACVRAIALAEMVDVAAKDRGRLARGAAELLLGVPAWALARSLVGLDRDLARRSLRKAAMLRLRHYGVGARIEGPGLRLSSVDVATAPVPARGPLLVVANHPGLYDALALFAAIAREDLSVIAVERPLFRALPHLQRRLIAIEPGLGAVALRRAVSHLEEGAALLHFPAGRIEPDPRIASPGEPLLCEWQAGVDTLVRAASRARPDLRVVPIAVSGVLSRRARAIAGAIARRRGLTDALVPLLELTLPGFGDVDVRVHVGPIFTSAELVRRHPTDVLRPALEALAEGART